MAETSTDSVRLTDRTSLAKVLVCAADGERVGITVAFGRADRAGGVLTIGLLPGRWLLVGADDSAGEVTARIEPNGEGVGVVDVTHGHALFRLRGVRASDVLAKLCALDLTDRAAPDGAVLGSLVAGVAATVIRDDEEGERSYLLRCDRSYGQYLREVLHDAGAEFGIEIEGG